MKSISEFVVAVLAGMTSLCISAHAQSVDVSAKGACNQFGQCDYFSGNLVTLDTVPPWLQ